MTMTLAERVEPEVRVEVTPADLVRYPARMRDVFRINDDGEVEKVCRRCQDQPKDAFGDKPDSWWPASTEFFPLKSEARKVDLTQVPMNPLAPYCRACVLELKKESRQRIKLAAESVRT